MMYKALFAAAAVLACAPLAMSADQKPAVQFRIDRERGGDTFESSEPVYSTSYERSWQDDRGMRTDARFHDRDGRWQDRDGRWHDRNMSMRRDGDMRREQRHMDRDVSRTERESGRGEFRDGQYRDSGVKIDTQKTDIHVRPDSRSDAGFNKMDADRSAQFRAQHNADHVAKPSADFKAEQALDVSAGKVSTGDKEQLADRSFLTEADLKDVDLNQCTFDFEPEAEATSMKTEPAQFQAQDVRYEGAPVLYEESSRSSNWNDSHGTKPAVQHRLNQERK